MTSGGDPEDSAGLGAGRLLVATPMLLDPNFHRSVVLLLDHDEAGALGVVLNRPSSVPVASVLPDWRERVSVPAVLFQGGPVGADSAIAVASLVGVRMVDGEPAEEPIGFRGVFGPVGIVDLDAPVEVLGPAMGALRIFAGYAGWGAGQLEAEIAEGSWLVAPAAHRDLFGSEPETLWATVLRRQPGELAWLSTMPEDPTLN